MIRERCRPTDTLWVWSMDNPEVRATCMPDDPQLIAWEAERAAEMAEHAAWCAEMDAVVAKILDRIYSGGTVEGDLNEL